MCSGTTGPKTREIPGKEAMTTFLNRSKLIEIDSKWTHIGLYGLRLKRFESTRCDQSNGTTPVPPNCHRKFKNQQISNGPHRPNCPLNLAINRIIKKRRSWTHAGLLRLRPRCFESQVCYEVKWTPPDTPNHDIFTGYGVVLFFEGNRKDIGRNAERYWQKCKRNLE